VNFRDGEGTGNTVPPVSNRKKFQVSGVISLLVI